MARCTAPVRGHRTASGRASCPACGRGSYGGYSGGYSPSNSYSISYQNPPSSSSRNSRGSSRRPSWSPAGSFLSYTPVEVRALSPIRASVEKRASLADRRDIFLCHAWDDRKGPAKELNDHLESHDISVWFSEKDVLLGSNLLREIDKGLANSKVGIVLVTPSFLERIGREGIAEKELSALLRGDLLVPIMHETTYEALEDVSPLLASRSGLSTSEDSMEIVAKKLAELVTIEI